MISRKHVFKASAILLASGSLLGACAKSVTHSAAQKTPAAATSSAKAKSAPDLVTTIHAGTGTVDEEGNVVAAESVSVGAASATTSTASVENISIEEASAFVFGGRIQKAPDQTATYVEAKTLSLSDITQANLDDATAKELSPRNLGKAQAAVDRENRDRLSKAQDDADQAAIDKYWADNRQADLANQTEQARIDYIRNTLDNAKSPRYVSIDRDTFFNHDDLIDLRKGLGLYKDLYNQGTHRVDGAQYESAVGRKVVAFLTHQPKGSERFYSEGYMTLVDLGQRAASESTFTHFFAKTWDFIRPWNKKQRLEDDAEIAKIGDVNQSYGDHLAKVAFVHRALQEFARTKSGDSLRLEGAKTYQFINFLKDALKAHQSGVDLPKTYGDEAAGD